MEDKHVLMFSGGLDSYLALLTLLDNGIKPKLVYALHGCKNEHEQLMQAIKLSKMHELELVIDSTLNLGKWENKENAFIPNRNGFLAYIGALYGNRIWFAIMDGEQTYTDCRPHTFLAVSASLTLLSGQEVVVDSPFWDLTKAEVIGNLKGMHFNNLKETYSCHNGEAIQCGHCSACFRRATAFILNGIREHYKVDPFNTGLAEQYYKRALKGKYGKRDREILKALELGGFKHE